VHLVGAGIALLLAVFVALLPGSAAAQGSCNVALRGDGLRLTVGARTDEPATLWVDWGDGLASSATGAARRRVYARHEYGTAGVYEVVAVVETLSGGCTATITVPVPYEDDEDAKIRDVFSEIDRPADAADDEPPPPDEGLVPSIARAVEAFGAWLRGRR
jgi:hypothetical protein